MAKNSAVLELHTAAEAVPRQHDLCTPHVDALWVKCMQG